MSITAPDDRGGPRAKYLRVADDIVRQVLAGQVRPGARLVSERDLAAHYECSFHTARHAIKVLREEWGVIETRHGSGNWVRQPPYTLPEGVPPPADGGA